MLIEPCPLAGVHPIIKTYMNIKTKTLLFLNFCIEIELKNKGLSMTNFYKESLDFYSRCIVSQIETMYHLLINYHIDQRLLLAEFLIKISFWW